MRSKPGARTSRAHRARTWVQAVATPRRRASSLESTSRSRRRASPSIVIVSPSLRARSVRRGWLPERRDPRRAHASRPKTTIGDEPDAVAELGTDEGRGRREHFTHARTASWAFVADDDDISSANSFREDRVEARLPPSNTRAGPVIDRFFTPDSLRRPNQARACRREWRGASQHEPAHPRMNDVLARRWFARNVGKHIAHRLASRRSGTSRR